MQRPRHAPLPPLSRLRGGYTSTLLLVIIGGTGERTHGCPAQRRRGHAAVPAVASNRRSSLINPLSKCKRDVFSTLITAAAAVPSLQSPSLPFAGCWVTRRAPSMTLTPTGSSSASYISSLLPGSGRHRAPPLPPQHQRVVTPVTPTHATAAGSSSMRHLFVCMVGKKYVFPTSSIYLLLRVETL